MNQDGANATKTFDESRRLAERAHDRQASLTTPEIQGAIAFGIEAVRTAALINAGAVATGLTFVAAVFKADERASAMALLHGPMTYFFIGMLAAGLASGFGYVAQYCYATSTSSYKLSWEWPYVDPSPGRWWKRAGMVPHALAVLSVVSAYGCLITGAAKALSMLQ